MPTSMRRATFAILVVLSALVSCDQLNPVKYVNSLDGSTLKFRGKYFDVDTDPFTLSYSQVYWTRQDFPLPQHIVKEFANKTIAITGFETTRYRIVKGKPTVVKVYELYNHHWTLGMLGNSLAEDARDTFLETKEHVGHENQPFQGSPLRAARTWMYANGNEDRLSYRGWPEGTACLIDSPKSWWAELMYINTINPLPDGRRCGPLPRISKAPRDELYSGLLECPCSDRHVFDYDKQTIDGYPCNWAPRDTLPECLKNNTAYDMQSYKGGLRCCNHMTLLTDKDQHFPGTEAEFKIRFRFYYEDATPLTKNALYAHVPIDSTEYDVPGASPGTPPQEAISEVSKVVSGLEFVVDSSGWTTDDAFELVYCHSHMHVGAIDFKLWDITRTPHKLLCETIPIYGSSDEAYDESGYAIGFKDCVWSHGGPLIKKDSKLMAVARYNNTYEHRGAMSRSSCYGVLPTQEG